MGGKVTSKTKKSTLPPPPMVGSSPRLASVKKNGQRRGNDLEPKSGSFEEADGLANFLGDPSKPSGASTKTEKPGPTKPAAAAEAAAPAKGAKAADSANKDAPPDKGAKPAASAKESKPEPSLEPPAVGKAKPVVRPPPRTRTPKPPAVGKAKSGGVTRPVPAEGEPPKDPTLTRVRLSGGVDEGDVESSGVQVLEQVHLKPGELVVGTRYRIVGWLGEGGMGVVYECEHVDIERRVALKVLRTAADPSSRRARMFREEARAVSRAGRNDDGQVSNVVEIYDFGELPDGRLWFAMELLQGRSMARMLAEGPMEVARLIGVLRQLCKGMAAVHDANVIHRDIKPGNIMLVRDRGRDDVVKVVDFGVATMLAEGDSAEVQLEGTPNYMAPEQALAADFDHRLDIYAVGAVAFHMLTGTPPFHGDDVFALLKRVCTEPPPRPSEVNPSIDIPPALEDVLLCCLQKDPNERYDDMRELEAALCEAQIAAKITTPWDDLPIPQVEPLARYETIVRGMPKPASTPTRSRMVTALVAAGIALVTLVGVGVMVSRSDDGAAQVDDRIARGVDAARAAASRAVYLYPPPDEPDTRTAYIEVMALEALAEEVGEGATSAASELRQEFADTLVRLGDRYWDREGGRPFAVDYYIAALVFDPSRDRIRERAPITAGQLTELQRKAGALDFAASELSASEPLLALAEDDDKERVRKLEEISNKSNDEELGVQSEMRIQKLIETEGAAAGVEPKPKPKSKRAARRPVPEPVPEPVPLVTDDDGGRQIKRSSELAQEGLQALRSGKRGRAETLFNRALAKDHRSHRALDGLAQVHFAEGNYQKAVSYGKQAVAIAGKRGNYRIHLGDAYFKVFRYAEAKEQYRKAKGLGHRDAGARLDKVNSKLGR